MHAKYKVNWFWIMCLLPTFAFAKTLVMCTAASPAGFDPAQYTTGTDYDASAQTVFNRLIEFGSENGIDLVPALAEKWAISKDGLQYTFYLRKGVSFQTTAYFTPTRPFNADDVLFTFARMQNSNSPFQKAYPVSFPYWADTGLRDEVVDIRKLDPYTVRFTLKNPDAVFLQDIALDFASIQSAEYAQQLLKQGKAALINQYPVGTGPFIFKSYQKDSQIRFVANPHYWDKARGAMVDNIVLAIATDATVRAQKLKSNECQIMVNPRPNDLAALKSMPSIKLLSQKALGMGYLGYNVQHKPLDNLKVRQALDMAINKKAIVEAVFQGSGFVANGPMPPMQWPYVKDLKVQPYDLAKAKALLAQAGYPNGFSITLWSLPVQRSYNPNGRLTAEMIQADWAKIGVKAKIVTYEWGEFIRRAIKGEHDAILFGWMADNADPDNWLNVTFSCQAVGGNNYSRWCYKPYDNLVKRAKTLTNKEERVKLYTQAIKIWQQQLPASPLAYPIAYVPISKNVTGYKVDPFNRHKLYGVGLK